MKYKGYQGSIETSPEDSCIFGQVQHIASLLSYEGQTTQELIKAFQSAVDEYLSDCREKGRTPEKPFKNLA